MISLSKPRPDILESFLQQQRNEVFSYDAVGTTATTPPRGFVVDRMRIPLGHGEPVFEAAREALQRWEQFRLGWVDVWPKRTEIRQGELVVVLGKAMGMWWINACRIVYVVNELQPVPRYGFAYGTLPHHIQTGEERFLIEWDPGNDLVYFDIMAFSRPKWWLTRLGYPLVRQKQKRFGREATAALLRAVQSQSEHRLVDHRLLGS